MDYLKYLEEHLRYMSNDEDSIKIALALYKINKYETNIQNDMRFETVEFDGYKFRKYFWYILVGKETDMKGEYLYKIIPNTLKDKIGYNICDNYLIVLNSQRWCHV